MRIVIFILLILYFYGKAMAQTPYRNNEGANFGMLKKKLADAEKLPKNHNNQLILLNALKDISITYNGARTFWGDTSIQYIHRWLAVAQETHNTEHEGYAATYKALIYVKEKKGKISPEELISLQKIASDACEQAGKKCIYQPLLDLIRLYSYYEARDFKKYFEYADKLGQSLGETPSNDGWDFIRLRRILTLAQYAEFRENNKQKALEFYTKGVRFLENSKPTHLHLLQVYCNWVAYTHLALKNFENAVEYNRRAFAYTEEIIFKNQVPDYEIWLSGSFNCQIDINLEAKNFDKADELGKYIINRWGSLKTEVDFYSQKYILAKNKGNYQEALQAFEKMDAMKDSTIRATENMKSAELQRKYDYEKVKFQTDNAVLIEGAKLTAVENNAKIAALKFSSEKEILEDKAKIAQLRSKEIEKEKINQELQIKLLNSKAIEQKDSRRNLSIGIILLMVLALSLFMNIRNSRKSFKRKIKQSEVELKETEANFHQKITEIEVTALRSQMNPHFIFNCLNSIKLYSLENDSQAASDYLTKFSKLIRMVLENSRSEKVTLENELEALELYIEMEAMRFKNKVKYQINVAQNIDQQFIEIPPLLIQPFVENSIWHGLMHKTEGGLVKIEVSQPNEQMLHIEISDNGIGREKALEYKSKSAMKNKSLGMKVTSERIELINQIYKTNTQVEIIDLKDQNGDAIGTRVILNIPI